MNALVALGLMAAASALLVAPPAAACPLSGTALRAYCDAYADEPQSREAELCAAYIRGFLDSVVAAGALPERSGQRHDRSETWTERAARTRLGSRRYAGQNQRRIEYCVDDGVSVADVIGRVLEYMRQQPPEEGTTAREIVDAVLRLNFRCPPPP